MTDPRYKFDPNTKVWRTPLHTGSTYSDGEAFEKSLLELLRACTDVTSHSKELLRLVNDWPSEYHLSTLRHNLLRPFNYGPSDHILELGCGCGAITRYLGETGATVVAVEGSPRRASIAAERCRDLPNVSVFCDNLIDFQTHKTFEYVTLIGVLEYSRVFIENADPVQACLVKAGSFLSPKGSLVIAIENQLGLKYLNGCSEDHVGVPYFGIHDLYGPGTPVTFGRRELESRLHASGFTSSKFYYPFPDYKVPSIILSEEAFDHSAFDVADILCRSSSRDYSERSYRAFLENLARRPLARNGLLKDVANSFLVLAHRTPECLQMASWLARVYSIGRDTRFSTETLFVDSMTGIEVEKKLLLNEGTQSIVTSQFVINHRPALRSPYIQGRLYITELQAILAQALGLTEVSNWASPWVKHLVEKSFLDSKEFRLLPGLFVDSIPTNLVQASGGAMIDIDLEWEIDRPIPLKWVLIRGLATAFKTSPSSPAFSGWLLKDCVGKVLRELGIDLSEADFSRAAVFEDALQSGVACATIIQRPFLDLLNEPAAHNNGPTTYQQQIGALNAEIMRMRGTASWQITKPLRLLAATFRFTRDLLARFGNALGALLRGQN